MSNVKSRKEYFVLNDNILGLRGFALDRCVA